MLSPPVANSIFYWMPKWLPTILFKLARMEVEIEDLIKRRDLHFRVRENFLPIRAQLSIALKSFWEILLKQRGFKC